VATTSEDIIPAFKKFKVKQTKNQKNTIHGKKMIGQSWENEVVSIFVISKIKTHCYFNILPAGAALIW
jgi:hypothetical protein